ncbi:MAG: 2-phospho-L-lactate guanylyltransferase [Anaerolineae bacterium]|nr:2-phospho-L-lactate guanylyltransferase [Anaerolineae bacterium]MDW8293430.1 2-phospho-L-lactate guanylyltransferase [Anaerolineae bacterium]
MIPLELVAVVPVKSLQRCKSRLSGEFDLETRIQITYDALRHVVHALRASNVVQHICVISRDAQVREWALAMGVAFLRERSRGLNAALRQAQQCYRASNALLIVPADLAALTPVDVRCLAQLAASSASPCVVIAPDHHERGTNALLLKPPTVIPVAFGRNSARRHAALALAHGAQPLWCRSESLALDLDRPEDLALYAQQW